MVNRESKPQSAHRDLGNENEMGDVAMSEPRPLRSYVLKGIVWCVILLLLDRLLFVVLKTGYDRYFGLHTKCEVVFVGNSRTALGIDHRLVAKVVNRNCGKFALNGATSQTRYAMLEYLCDTQPECEIVVLDVSAYSFNDKNLSTGAYTLLYPYMNSDSISRHVSENSRRFGEVQLRQLFSGARFNSTTLNLAVRGLLGRDDNLKFSSVNLKQVQHRIANGKTQSLDVDPAGLKLFEKSLKLLRENNKKVILVYMPVVKLLNDVDRPQHDANVERLTRFAEESLDVYFLDLNRDYEENYEIMYDGIHVNKKGKKQLSRQIAEFLKGISKS